MDEPVFASDGASFMPSRHALGPWDPRALHGGAPAALLARAVERYEPQENLRVARLSYEFVRPVPLAPLEVTVTPLRLGRRVQLLGASLTAAGVEVCRLTASRIAAPPAALARVGPLARGQAGGAGVPLPDQLQTVLFDAGRNPGESFGATTMEMRVASGELRAAGPAAVWMRLLRPIVDGEQPTPLMRIAAVADFGNGISAELDFERTLFLNTDLVIHLSRRPAGEWILLSSRTQIEPGAGALAASELYDEHGAVGVAAQSLLIEVQ